MMALTTRGRYATRILICLARRRGERPATKHEIGRSEGISPNYVEQIMVRLRAARLVRSHRGRGGGFDLARDAARITLAQVLRAVEGPVAPAPCLVGPCPRAATCPARPVWRKTARAIERVLEQTTIAQMAQGKARAAKPAPPAPVRARSAGKRERPAPRPLPWRG
jgi:Rrf2 family transcriptional regulator, cysteine metabolism repressor